MIRNFSCLLLVFSAISCTSEHTEGITIIDKSYIQQEVVGKAVMLIDVRTQKEFSAGHIEDAVNYNIIDSDAFLLQIAHLDKDRPVYLYCKRGIRSGRAARLLKKEGFTRIYDYSGGYNDWVKQ